MPVIRTLPPDLVGQIAAGEVVERPAAAVKELCENALDAQATTVLVEIRGGGIESIRVADNGCGIPAAELRMAFERHATSKIRTVGDLNDIHTMGFRGEALHAIAAVARVTLTSRARGAQGGMAISLEGGVVTDLREAACPVGTSVLVKDLFFNTPVRRKFLKSPLKEAATVIELGARLILSAPGVSFRFVQDGKTIYHSAGDGRLESALCAVFGLSDFKGMRRLDGHGQGMDLTGYVGVGDQARGNRAQQYFYINGRAMKSALLSGALEEGCRQRVMVGRFPVCALHIAMPFAMVDVNVHPNKWEVRFQNERAVYEQTVQTVLDALGEDTPLARVPAFDEKKNDAPPAQVRVQSRVSVPAPPPAPAPVRDTPIPPAPAAAVMRDSGAGIAVPPSGFGKLPALPERPVSTPPAQAPVSASAPAPTPEQMGLDMPRDEVRVIGVAFDTYVLAEYGDQLLLIDQHAAHERLLYERLKRELDTRVAAQTLLTPEIVSLSPREYACMMENLPALRKAGFDAEPFGEDAVTLRALPMVLGVPSPAALIRDILGGMDDYKQTVEIPTRTHAIIEMACKHAVKGGERLPIGQVRALISDMIARGVTPTCPHGRPLVVALTRTDLEKRFRRIQS